MKKTKLKLGLILIIPFLVMIIVWLFVGTISQVEVQIVYWNSLSNDLKIRFIAAFSVFIMTIAGFVLLYSHVVDLIQEENEPNEDS